MISCTGRGIGSNANPPQRILVGKMMQTPYQYLTAAHPPPAFLTLTWDSADGPARQGAQERRNFCTHPR